MGKMKLKPVFKFIIGFALLGANSIYLNLSSDNLVSRRLRRASDNFVPDWVNSLDQAAVFSQVFQQVNIPPENLDMGEKYQLLHLYEKYFSIMDRQLSYEERFRKLANAFINETNLLLALEQVFSSFGKVKPSELKDILDLGINSWPYIHLLNLLFPNATRIVGVERNPNRVADAMAQLNFWKLDNKKNIITLGDITQLDLIPDTHGKFHFISLLHQFILPRIGNYNFEENLRLFEGIQKRLADEGIFVTSANSTLWGTYFHLMDKALLLAGMSKMVVGATVFAGESLNTAGYLENLFSDKLQGKRDFIYIGWKDQVGKVTAMLENIFLIQEEFGEKAAVKLFGLKNEEKNRYVGIEVLLREDLQNKLWERLRKANLNDDKEWLRLAHDLLRLLG